MDRETTCGPGYVQRLTDTEQADLLFRALVSLYDEIYGALSDAAINANEPLARAMNEAQDAMAECSTFVPATTPAIED